MENEDRQDADGIKDQNWSIVDAGSKVISADGDEIGTVRETMPDYLTLKVRRNLLTEAEMYVPRAMVDRVDDGGIHLTCTAAELDAMDLTEPPALRTG